MKDFDVVRFERVNPDRTVRIGGQELTFRPSVPAEVFATWLDGRPETEAASLEEADRFVLACLEEGQEEAWRAARSSDIELPLSTEDIRDLIRHILEVAVNRPTERPSGSSTGRSSTGTKSTESLQPPEGES